MLEKLHFAFILLIYKKTDMERLLRLVVTKFGDRPKSISACTIVS